MKNDEMLQNAIGLIDDELILDAKRPGKKKSLWVRWVAAAACLALSVGCIGRLAANKDTLQPPNDPQSAPQAGLKTGDNLWQQENFTAYSLSYGSGASSLSSSSGGNVVLLSNEASTIQTQSITISPNQTFKFENLIAQRYAVYLSETGFPVFYDTAEDRELDLQERILGDTSHILARFKELAFAVAEKDYAGFIASEANRQILDLYLTYLANDTLSERWDEIEAITPDIGFMEEMAEYQNQSEAQKREACWNMPWSIFYNTLADWEHEPNQLDDATYVVSVLGVDSTNGICIVRGNTLTGDGAFYGYYNIQTDTLKHLPDSPGNNMIGVMQRKGFTFRFSADGSIATIAWPACDFQGTSYLYALDYRGENIGVFFLDHHTAHTFQPGWSDKPALAASELYISDNNNVLYYKTMDETLVGRFFPVNNEVWANRLTLFQHDTDIWAFHLVDEQCNVSKAVELQGNFVRFAGDETTVIMERGGSYYAYALADGSDITQDVISGSVSTYAHEQLMVTLEDGKLYATNIFTGQRQMIGAADEYILTDDGAFAFAYCQGDSYVTCYNVVSAEHCQIQIDGTLSNQLFSGENVVLQMSHNQEENTLLISYYIREDVIEREPVDFYGLVAQLERGYPDDRPRNPRVITDLYVTEAVMDAFRDSAYRYDHPDGIIYWRSYYPEFISYYEDRHSIFQRLGLTEPEDYLDVKGTKFILYEDEDEQLALVFHEGWLLYDYQDWYSGFHIDYTVGGRTYDYQFMLEGVE